MRSEIKLKETFEFRLSDCEDENPLNREATDEEIIDEPIHQSLIIIGRNICNQT
jgi:hypothetical protein